MNNSSLWQNHFALIAIHGFCGHNSLLNHSLPAFGTVKEIFSCNLVKWPLSLLYSTHLSLWLFVFHYSIQIELCMWLASALSSLCRSSLASCSNLQQIVVTVCNRDKLPPSAVDFGPFHCHRHRYTSFPFSAGLNWLCPKAWRAPSSICLMPTDLNFTQILVSLSF